MIRWLRSKAYPTFECEDCIGMKEHGCQCAYYGAFYPGTGHMPWWAKIIRIFVK